MKKLVLSLMVMGGFLFFATNVANAQEAQQKQETSQNVRTGFVDTTGDGVCDNYDGTQAGKGLGPGNGQGEGRATGQRQGRRQGLRDGSGQGERQFDGTGPRRGNRTGARNGSGPNCAPVKNR